MQRDLAIEYRQRDNPGIDVYEDRDLDITSYLPIDVEMQIKQVLAVMPD